MLATTSVGQEGLDFHTYCHAMVHWNLPSNAMSRALPLSRDVKKLEALKRSMAAYRMMMGQPRQDDLLEFLEGREIDPTIFAIDLRPEP